MRRQVAPRPLGFIDHDTTASRAAAVLVLYSASIEVGHDFGLLDGGWKLLLALWPTKP